jgi:ATP-dependent Clp protease ATP-binding subunit ClpA
MFERFTAPARAVVVAAQSEARALGHGYIGCEHLLIALADGSEGAAAPALRAAGADASRLREAVAEIVGTEQAPALDADALAVLGIDLDEVRRRVEGAFGPGALERGRAACGGAMPFTPRAKRVLQGALHAAIRRGDRHIGAEHILLAILDQDAGVAPEALARVGVAPERVREQLEVRSI